MIGSCHSGLIEAFRMALICPSIMAEGGDHVHPGFGMGSGRFR